MRTYRLPTYSGAQEASHASPARHSHDNRSTVNDARRPTISSVVSGSGLHTEIRNRDWSLTLSGQIVRQPSFRHFRISTRPKETLQSLPTAAKRGTRRVSNTTQKISSRRKGASQDNGATSSQTLVMAQPLGSIEDDSACECRFNCIPVCGR